MQNENRLIGMIVPTVDNSFFAGLSCEADRYLNERQYELVLCVSANDAEREKVCFRRLLSSGVAGILCVSGLSALPEDLLPENYPLVWLDRRPQAKRPVPWAANDDAAATEEATAFLLEKGCKNILLLPGFLAEHQESPRVAGYRRALEKKGVAFREEYILRRSGKKSSEAETEELLLALLKNGDAIDGVIASSDRSAFGAMTALRKVGRYTPEDVKLICFDNSPYSAMASPAITALDRNPKLLAERACETLLQILSGAAKIEEKMLVPVSLVQRDSTR